MINLIPNQEKKKKVKDFYFRLGVVFIAAMGCAVFTGMLILLPAYFLSEVEKNLAVSRLEAQKKEPVPVVDEDSLRTMQELGRKVEVVENSYKNSYKISEKVVNQILVHKTDNIKINRISFENDLKSGKKIAVYGTAPSRESLLFFRRSLEDDVAFKSVDLPISNFIKGSDIEFYISLYAE